MSDRAISVVIVAGVGLAAYLVWKLVDSAKGIGEAGTQAAGYFLGFNPNASLGSDLFDVFNRDRDAAVGAGTTELRTSPQGYGVSINATTAGNFITDVFNPATGQWQGVKPRRIPDGWQAWAAFDRNRLTASLPTTPPPTYRYDYTNK